MNHYIDILICICLGGFGGGGSIVVGWWGRGDGKTRYRSGRRVMVYTGSSQQYIEVETVITYLLWNERVNVITCVRSPVHMYGDGDQHWRDAERDLEDPFQEPTCMNYSRVVQGTVGESVHLRARDSLRKMYAFRIRSVKVLKTVRKIQILTWNGKKNLMSLNSWFLTNYDIIGLSECRVSSKAELDWGCYQIITIYNSFISS